MFWILERNLYSEANFASLVNALERLDCQYEIVKRIPFINTLVPDISLPDNIKHVFVCGSTGMGEVVKQKGWFPGYFDENLDYELVMQHFGRWCLNHRGQVTTLRKASDLPILRGGPFFARPVSDKKSFAGTVFDAADFAEWRSKVLQLEIDNTMEENSLTTLKPDDRIVLAPLTNIYQEYRFFVVDQQVVTGSMYKLGSRVISSIEVPERISAFAQRMADHWSPNRAYCLDIAVTDDDEEFGDMKVIEINALNSAGFYACDMLKFVTAVNEMQFD